MGNNSDPKAVTRSVESTTQPRELMEMNLEQFIQRYSPSESYGEYSTQEYFDPRLEGFLAVASRLTEQMLVPNALEGGTTTEAIVMRLDPYDPPPYSSLDPRSEIESKALEHQMQSFVLKCYDLKTPSTCFVTPKQMTRMDPAAIQDLPGFVGVWEPATTMPRVGDVVKVKYHSNSYKGGEFIRTLGINVLHMLAGVDPNGSVSMADKFAGALYNLINVGDYKKATQSEIKECAAKYDQSRNDFTWKSNHSTVFRSMDSRLVPVAKCFAYRCFKQKGVQIKFNSSYRSVSKQRTLRLRWLTGEKDAHGNILQKLQPAASWAPVAEHVAAEDTIQNTTLVAGPDNGSWHQAKLAFDFNPYFSDGTALTGRSSSKAEWFSKGGPIVRIGKSIGLFWGGDFKTNWDPIHFDMRSTLGRSAKSSAIATIVAAEGAVPA